MNVGDLIEEPTLIQPEEPKSDKPKFEPRPPDFIGNDHNAVAWIANKNPDGEIIALNVKIGELYFKLRKRFL